MLTKIYSPNAPNVPLKPDQIADWANKVHRLVGGGKDVFTARDFSQILACHSRLGGCHCSCGVNEKGFSNGQFDLLPLDDEAVISGGKAYMVCRVCGGISHL